MPPFQTDRHTHIALLTMEVIDSQPLADSAYPAVMAVVDVFARVRVPQFAFFAVVFGNSFAAGWVGTVVGGGLDGAAVHAHHRCDEISGYENGD